MKAGAFFSLEGHMTVHHPLRAIHTHALDFWMARTSVVVIIALQLWLGIDVAVGPIWLASAIEACLLVLLSVATAWAQDLAVKATSDHHWHLIARRRCMVGSRVTPLATAKRCCWTP